jgi:hypothetical protein
MNVSYRRSVQARFAAVLDDDDVDALLSTIQTLSRDSGLE